MTFTKSPKNPYKKEPAFSFIKIMVDRKAQGSPLTQEILKTLAHLPQEWVEEDRPRFPLMNRTSSKRVLYLTHFQGQLVKPCPGTKDYLCCGYQILHTAVNCPMDCSYCILQAYFNQPFVRLFVNTEEIFRQLHEFLIRHQDETIRLGTGEFTDSLVLDPLTRFSSCLLQEILPHPKVVVELKTKSAAIDSLLRLNHPEKFIIAWSLNPAELIKREEKGSAPLSERLAAARQCQDKGYRLGFHFDPIFYYPGWEEAYRRTVQRLFSKIEAGRIAWISLGCFRYLPELRSIMEGRQPASRLIHEEFIPALDKKMRDLQVKRVEIYAKMLDWIRRYGGDCLVYLCMENEAVWEKVFGFIPGQGSPSLKEMLDQRV
jgi:spore photoproduct lyase